MESDPQPGDVYLDDGDHGALSAKFAMDYKSMGFLRPDIDRLWGVETEQAMESQKVRDALEEFEAWERAGRPVYGE